MFGNPKKSNFKCRFRKICEYGSAHGVNIAVYGKCQVDYLVRKIQNTQYLMKKNSVDTSHQALTQFIFSENLKTDFRRN